MQVFRAFLKIMIKHWVSIAVYIGLYAIMLFLISYTYKDTYEENFRSTNLDISVIDRDNSEASKGLAGYLENKHSLIEIEDNEESIQDYIYYRYVDYVLIIPKGFEEKLLAGKTKDLVENVRIPGSSKGTFLDNQVEGYLKDLQVYLSGGYDLTEAINTAGNFHAQADNIELVSFSKETKRTNEAIFYFFQYQPYVYILLLVCGLAPVILIMNKKEIYNRNACSPMSLISKNMQITLGSIFFSIMVFIIFIILGFLMFGRNFICPELGYLLINSGAFLIFTIALTFLICMVLSEDLSSLSLVANVVGLGMCFLCGVFVPQSLLSPGVLSVARFLPAYWYIRNNNILAGLSDEAFTVSGFYTSIGIQGLFAAVFFAVALVVSKVNRQRG